MSLVDIDQYFRVVVEAESSQMSVNIYQTTQHHISDGSHNYSHDHEKLKSHLPIFKPKQVMGLKPHDFMTTVYTTVAKHYVLAADINQKLSTNPGNE